MKHFALSLFLVLSWAAAAQTSGSIVLGHSDTIVSKAFGSTQQINIYLPDGYNPDSATTYPVIYLLDGAVDQDFVHMAGLVQFSSFSWVNYLPPSILVGIVNQDRRLDMTYCTADSFVWPKELEAYAKDTRKSGGSAAFMNYIENDLIPYVESHYKCSGTRTLIGQSLAGLFATEMLLKKPSLFNKYVIISPSLWWGNESLLKDAPQLLKALPETPLQVYISAGKEGRMMEQDARNLAKAVQKAGKPQTKVIFEFLPKEDHGTILHQAASNAFEWMMK